MYSLRKSESNETYTVGTNVTVVVRVRPIISRELDQRDVKSCLHVAKNVVTVNRCLEFIFDHCIKPNQDNSYLYEQIGEPLLEHALDGYNVCMFAYGQTGSGKTHSIMGREDDPGIMHQFVMNLFERTSYMTKSDAVRVKVECSYYEIYNEKIHDLLGNDSKTPLRVREHPVNGPYIVDLSTIECSSYEDVVYWINIAQKRRLTASTCMNQKSSRSHTIFTLVITQDKDLDDEFKQSITSKVNIVDLAGSERSHVVNATGKRLQESVLINKSLLTLGKVITQLAEFDYVRGSSNSYIPYRDSVLTWLLKESLGGNSKTTMIATVSPANCYQEETLTTLRYAATARRVVNIVKINEDPKIRKIRELEQEIQVLKQRIALMESAPQPRARSSVTKRSSNCCNSGDRSRPSNISNSSPIRVYQNSDLIKHIKEIFADILNEDSPSPKGKCKN